MIALRKRKQRVSSATGASPLSKKLKDCRRNMIDIEWEAGDCCQSSSSQPLWTAASPETEEQFELERSPFVLDPLRNDLSLLQRQQQRDFASFVGLLLQKHNFSPAEIRSKLRDKAFLAQTHAFLRSLVDASRAIEAEH